MEYFSGIDKISYEGKDSKNMYSFKHYDPNEIIMGKKLKDHLRFSMAFWHTMTQDGSDPFGNAINKRNWEGTTPLDTAKNRIDAFFELLIKLDIEYFCFHDIDIAPEGNSLEEFFENLDYVTDLIKNKMDETGKKLLWNTTNTFSNPRFVHGAATSSVADVFAITAAQVKKGLDISKKLNGKNYVFWGGREGYESLLNTDIALEQDNMARLFSMAIDYSKKINHSVQFLLEPKPKEPMTHQYDYDAATTMAFIQKYKLQDYFKLNLEANHATLAGHTFEHELAIARTYNALGSIDANQGNPLLGWDTDEFPTNLFDTTLAMYQIVENGGIAPGGINFDAKVRRTSFEQDDLILAHISGMDTYARAFKSAVRLKEDSFFDDIIEKKYESYKEGIGKEIISGSVTLENLFDYALMKEEVEVSSSHIEYIKSCINDYIY